MYRERAVFFFLLLPGIGGGSYTLHCPPGSTIEFVIGLCRTDNPATNRHHTVAFIYKTSGCSWPKATLKPMCEIQVEKKKKKK
jgi:hypothetical protein